ncbi:MAG: flagellar biosynthesis protein FliQ [Chloroflexi bacterium]|nr:MAG: flagellar biosynthesis protein FliQ [Chloroflexota bacterium]
MNQDTVIHLAMQALIVALKVSMPFLLAGLVVGLAVSVFQAVTQIQEQTLSFIPKILVTGAVMAIGGPWMLSQMIAYTEALYTSIPSMVGP